VPNIPEPIIARLKGLFPDISDIGSNRDPGSESPWKSQYTHPLFFPLVMNYDHGPGWVFYEPETIDALIKGSAVDDTAFNTLLSVKSCIHSDLPWNNVAAFNNVAVSFSGVIPDVDILESLFPYEADFAIDSLKRIDKRRPFSPDVLTYVSENAKIFSGLDGVGEDFIKNRAMRIARDLAFHYGDI
jgi:hypothetical protein